MVRFRPDVGDQDSITVSSDGALKHVGEFALAIGNVLAFLVSGAYDDLLQERQRPVDVVCLTHGDACCSCFLCTLVSSEVYQVKLGCDHFL